MTISTLGLTAERAAAMLDAREVSCEELASAYLERIEADTETGAFLHVHPELTLERARGFDRSGRSGTAGVPIGLKDLLSTRGIPTTAGSRILDGFRPIVDADVVEATADAGLISLGKLNMDEFAMGSSTEHSGYQLTRNPWDPALVPGGSSGGSAAAVAAGLAPWTLGTDTGGSIRQPAAFCGVVGLKPTYGAVSRYGMIAFASSLDQCGPLTRDVADAALLLGVLQGRDPCDSTSVGIEGGVALPSREDLKGLSFGIPRELASEAEGIEAGVLDAFAAALERARDKGSSGKREA